MWCWNGKRGSLAEVMMDHFAFSWERWIQDSGYTLHTSKCTSYLNIYLYCLCHICASLMFRSIIPVSFSSTYHHIKIQIRCKLFALGFRCKTWQGSHMGSLSKAETKPLNMTSSLPAGWNQGGCGARQESSFSPHTEPLQSWITELEKQLIALSSWACAKYSLH